MHESSPRSPSHGPFSSTHNHFQPATGAKSIVIDPPTPPRQKNNRANPSAEPPAGQQPSCISNASDSTTFSPAPDANSLSSISPLQPPASTSASSDITASREPPSLSELITLAPLSLLEKAVVILFLTAAMVFSFGGQDKIYSALYTQIQRALSEIASTEITVESLMAALKILGPAVLLSYTVDSDPRSTDATLIAFVQRCRDLFSWWRDKVNNCYQRSTAAVQSLVAAFKGVLKWFGRLPLVVRYLVVISLAAPLMRYGVVVAAQLLATYSVEIGSATGIVTMSFATVSYMRTKQHLAKAASSLSAALKQMLAVYQANPNAVDGFYPANYLREEVVNYVQRKDSVGNEEVRQILGNVDLRGFPVSKVWLPAATELRKDVRVQVVEKEFHGKRQTCWRILSA